MKTFTSGAKSSEESPRYDLVPLASLKRQAARMAQGAATHGEHNYRKGANDPTFIRDRINHLLGHALAYASGDRSDDHLGAVLANAGMLADLEAAGAHVCQDSQRVGREGNAERCPDSPCDQPKRDEQQQLVDVGAHVDHASTARMTYDERRSDLKPCRCGAIFTHPERCDANEKCMAAQHPHFRRPLTLAEQRSRTP